MDIGLTPQQQTILRRARRKRLLGAERWQVIPPLWVMAGTSLAPLLLILHPSRYLPLVVVPPLGLWQRSRVEQRIAAWALDLREI
jgi:hypothetical protein